MKTITLVANNRLDYLKRMIESLKENNLFGYRLFVGVEPEDRSIIEFCQSFDFMPVNVTVNPRKLGVALNPLATISRAFDAGSEFNVALEDDLILSPDALDLANWYRVLPEKNYFCLNLFNYGSNPAEPEKVQPTDHFAPLGWAVTESVWRQFIKPNWMSDSRGWDYSMNAIFQTLSGWVILQPVWGRSNHIGREGGRHCGPEFHDRMFSRLSISTARCTDYRLVSGKEK